MTDDRVPGFATLAVHAGASPGSATDAPPSPIYQSAATASDGVGQAAPHFSLAVPTINPTQAVLEERIAALEGGSAAVAVASGHAARVVAFQTLMAPGDEFIAARQIDGGSIDQFNNAFRSFGWRVRWAEIDDVATFEAAVSPKTKAIFIESIASPGGIVTDVAAIAAVAKRAGVPLIVDNSLATPYLIRPFAHGADVVVHELAGFLGGHGNATGGVVVDGGGFNWVSKRGRFPFLSSPRPEYNDIVIGDTYGNYAFATAARELSLRGLGPSIAPMAAFLILTGIETLPLRMRKQCDNARAVAEFLADHDKVTWVSYAGLPGDRYHQLARRYCPNGAGAVLTFGVDGGDEARRTLVSEVKLFSPRADVGGTRSSIIRPSSTAFRQLAADTGLDVVRISVGIEDVADIVGDLEQALAKV